jgi:hypothetical protein
MSRVIETLSTLAFGLVAFGYAVVLTAHTLTCDFASEVRRIWR